MVKVPTWNVSCVQTFADGNKVNQMMSTRTLELNPRHPIISKLNAAVSEDGGEEAESNKDLAWLIHDTALTTSGFLQDDAESFAERMYRTIAGSLDVKSMELEPEIEVPEEEEEEETEDGSSSEDSGSDEL